MPLIFFGTLFLFLILGFPVAFTLGGVSLFFGYFTCGLPFLNLLPLRIWGVMSNYLLISVPLFVYMGVMLERSGVSEKLLETMALLFGKIRGGIAISVVIVGALLAASTGIVGATVVTMGLLSLPTMLKRGYDPRLATGTIAAAGTLGQIIPPSIVLVLLGSVLNIPTGDMFMGAVLPGIILVLLYLVWIGIVSISKPEQVPKMTEKEIDAFRGKAMFKQILSSFVPPFSLIVIVLGSIFAGIASPTEAAAVGALGATILTILKGKFKYSTLKSVMTETTHLTCMVFIILVGATFFGLVFRGMEGDRYITDLITGAKLSPNVFIALVMIIIFVAGFFIDFFEITFIIVPVVAPIFKEMGIDLLWIGILIAINFQTSFLTPPLGFALFYLKGVAPKEIKTSDIYKGVVPYIGIQIIGLLLVLLVPEIVTWLPKVFGR